MVNLDIRWQALHFYFMRAACAREDLVRAVETPAPPLDPPEFWGHLPLILAHNRMVTFYGLIYVVLEGLKECKVEIEALGPLLASPNYDKLRRLRNAAFHYQPHPLHEKLAAFIDSPDSEKWISAVFSALNGWFSDNVTQPTLEERPDLAEAIRAFQRSGAASSCDNGEA